MPTSAVATCAIRLFLLSLLVMLGACATDMFGTTEEHALEPVEISHEFTATAEVVGLNEAKRLIMLRRDDGSIFNVQAGDEVRNFKQIELGDSLRLRYRESLTATLLPAGQSSTGADIAVAAGRAQPGAKPGAGMGISVNLRVRVESIDTENDIVVFSPASGELIAHAIVTPEGRAFVKELHVGDTVQLDYTEALALSIEEL